MQLSVKIRLACTAAFVFATLLQVQAQQTPTASPPQQLPHVTYANGLLTVAASNSSLNQILRDIARETGMKITGGVTEERVFGQYGPAAPSKVLGELLDGTGTNMLLVHGTTATPAELVLTPRQGGPTPPNPSAYREDQSPAPERPQYPINAPQSGNAQGEPVNAEGMRSPNEVKTPQQIYEQLERMRQQQQQQQSNPQ